ncbi:tRNA dimethylallyltransferase [Lachnellula suecica]|uniref:tRNA dimethylallyltransferase n=1 Tax=Lachnellula suecica TaxID=602035 RepID=A0A8T9CNB6_9HELO|nr:tRNA dimethylallyltransferase [Lachnellula suecica]
MAKRPPMDPLIVVLGATGTGKSQLAVDLATRFDGEIINGDTMQMYDGLPIVTNKITAEEQKGIPHHLLGNVALDEEPWRVGVFKTKASQIIREIRSRGRLPILVGGTHYYTQSLLFEGSLVEHAKRELEDQQESSDKFPILKGTTEEMLERLREIDPVMANQWHPNDRRRIRRSLEIFLTTGKKASDVYAEQKQQKRLNKETGSDEEEVPHSPVADGSTLFFWVHSDYAILKERLNSRIDKMARMGLLDEVKSLDEFLSRQRKAGNEVDLTRGIWVSIGWKEFEPYLAALKTGAASPEELEKLHDLSVEQTKSNTRQYAKRQVRWIRIKLASALSEENALDKLYLLDSSDVTQFDAAVSAPAIDITASFLNGDSLPLRQELSEAAKKFLTADSDVAGPRNIEFRQECKTCDVTLVIEEQWIRHLKTRRHRALEKKRLKNAAYGSLYQNIESTPGTDIT